MFTVTKCESEVHKKKILNDIKSNVYTAEHSNIFAEY